MSKDYKKLRKIYADDPVMLSSIRAEEQIELLHEIANKKNSFEGVESIKGDKGDKGDTGEQGIQGEKGDMGDVGHNGKDGKNGRDGKNGITPVKGVDYFDGKDGINGKDGKDGKDGNVEPLEIVSLLKKLPEKDKLDISHLRNSAEIMSAIGKMKSFDKDGFKYNGKKIQFSELLHGGGMSTALFISGEVVSGSGTSWTLSNNPALFLALYGNGQRLSTSRGDYTISGKNITTAQPWNAGDLEADYYK